jgi:hypothetical protein
VPGGMLGKSALIDADWPAESVPVPAPLAVTLNVYGVPVVKPTKVQVRGATTALQSDDVVGAADEVTV